MMLTIVLLQKIIKYQKGAYDRACETLGPEPLVTLGITAVNLLRPLSEL
jgi:hypothetical protein